MKKHILDRYSRTDDGKITIDIAAGKVEDLYNDFDKFAPYVKKDLDQNLVDYLINSVGEISREDFVIKFRLRTPADAHLCSLVKTSVQNYFLYLRQLEIRELARMTRASFILFSIGVVILCLSVWVNQRIADYGDFVTHIFSEGLNVAAWGSLWNAI